MRSSTRSPPPTNPSTSSCATPRPSSRCGTRCVNWSTSRATRFARVSEPPAGHVYVTRLLTDDAMAELQELGHPLVVGAERPPARDELLRRVTGAAAVVCPLTDRIDAAVLDAAGPQLRIVANVAVGVDNIDVPAARESGVVVTNTPGVLDDATADLAVGLVLAAARRIAEGDRFLRRAEPWVWGPRMMIGLDLSAGATLGIVGYGRIGRAVARRARGFGVRMAAPPPPPPPPPRGAARGRRRGRDVRRARRAAGRERRRRPARAAHRGDPPPDRRGGAGPHAAD